MKNIWNINNVLLEYVRKQDEIFRKLKTPIVPNISLWTSKVLEPMTYIYKIQEMDGIVKYMREQQRIINKCLSIPDSYRSTIVGACRKALLTHNELFTDLCKAIPPIDYSFSKPALGAICGLDSFEEVVLNTIEECFQDEEISNEDGEDKINETSSSITDKLNDRIKNLSPLQTLILNSVIIPIIINYLFFGISALWDNMHQSTDAPNGSVTETIDYYIVENNFDPNMLNLTGYCIISEPNCMVRIHPDRSSRVVGHLQVGRVVRIVDKWKKWIRISWVNSDQELFCGWIQNYKVTYFK